MCEPRDRQFYSIPDKIQEKSKLTVTTEGKKRLLNYIGDNIIGKDKMFSGPFGLRKVSYLDYIASGRALRFIEDYIRDEVLPEYGNTHTTTSVTSLQTTMYRHEARDIIRNSVNASEHDAVIFTGSGSTSAIHKLIHALDLKQPPVVFVGPYEHHSSFLPWKEIGSKVVRIKQTQDGLVDIDYLERQIKFWKRSRRQLIGCFSAASNVTGILVDVNAISICLHKHGALAFWDYATAAPYVKVDLNPVITSIDQPYVHKDAVFISPHKFVGGVSTPGVLIAKKKLFQNHVPEGCGGGTVFFVRRDNHRYLQEPEMKEEGGTPAIVESIRAGLVFQLKESVTSDLIMERETELVRKANEVWKDIPELVVLGQDDLPRLPVFSFLVYNKGLGRFLHHNFVSTVLNDVFGIQARGGCACAGPYAMVLDAGSSAEMSKSRKRFEKDHSEIRRGQATVQQTVEESVQEVSVVPIAACSSSNSKKQTGKKVSKKDLMGMSENVSKKIEELLVEDSRLDRTHLRRYREYSQREILRPGFTRINLPYFMTDDFLDFVLEAVELTAKHAWKLLPQYMFNPETGEWRHRNFQVFKDRKWLGHISYVKGEMTYKVPPHVVKSPLPDSYEDCITKAKDILCKAGKMRLQMPDHTLMFNDDTQSYRWFLLPSEAHDYLHGDTTASSGSISLPFCPPKIRASLGLPAFEAESTVDDFDEEELLMFTVENRESITTTQSGAIYSSGKEILLNNDGDSGFELKNEKTAEKHGDSDNTILFCGLQNELERGFHCVHCEESSSVCDNCITVNSAGSGDERVDTPSNSSDRKPVPHSEEKKKEITSSSQTSEPLPSSEKISDSAPCNSEDKIDTSKNFQVESDIDCANKIRIKDRKPEESENVEPSKLSCVWHSPPKCIFSPFLKGVQEFEMVKDGDKILVCLSGGKDSLSLLHTIRQYQFYCKGKSLKFEFGAVTVDPQTPSYDPSPLKEYLASLGVPYFYESQCIMEAASNLPYECASICSFCSRMKRGRIYACARREGYNVLALGQHLDDLTESFLMSFFHNGAIRTMKAHYTVSDGDLRVTRPFVYVREKDLRTFAEKNKLPVIAENCPACFEAPKERHRTKQLLASQEIMFPNIYNSMLAAMKPVMSINRTGQKFSDTVTEEQDDFDI